MALLEIRLFGEPRITLGERQISNLIGQKPGHLLCILLLNRPRPILRETLASLLWPDSELARPNARTALWRLRAAIEPTSADRGRFIATTAQSVAFNALSDHWLDVGEFERLTRPPAPDAADETADERAARLRRACDLYSGDLIEGCYEDWCLEERERLQKRYVDALRELLEHHAARREFDSAIEVGRLILQRDRTQESTHRELMRLHYLAGRREVALQQYALCREALRRELGIEPMRETTTLCERIRQEQAVPESPVSRLAPLVRVPDETEGDPIPALRAALLQLEQAAQQIREALERAEQSAQLGTNGNGPKPIQVLPRTPAPTRPSRLRDEAS